MLYVVGSGPAGVSAAKALLNRGETVTMLDAGVTLEQSRQRIVEQLKNQQNWRDWEETSLEAVKGETGPHTDGPKKLAYGSDYVYRDVEEYLPLQQENVNIRPSFAKGGLSAVWGAQIMPYAADEISEWPITPDDLAPYYRQVFEFMPHAAENDRLSDRYPLYSESSQSFALSAQAAWLYQYMEQQTDTMEDILFGRSRLAVWFEQTEEKHGCVYCGRCLYGCPYQLIYSAAETVDDLKNHSRFTYRPNTVVEEVVENDTAVTIHAQDKATGENQTFTGERVFLGCGTVPTTKIMLASMDAYGTLLTMKQSQHFFLPGLMYRSMTNVEEQRHHALAQLYLEIFNGKTRPAHAQLYTYLDIYEGVLKDMFGKLYSVLRRIAAPIIDRLLVLKVFLHSKHSPDITVELERGDPAKLCLTGETLGETRKHIRKVLHTLWKQKKSLGFLPLTPFYNTSKPGGSNHYGGTFPMQHNPGQFETDTHGRPADYDRVHLVDASTFPTIPGQTITLTIMANAYRIAATYDNA